MNKLSNYENVFFYFSISLSFIFSVGLFLYSTSCGLDLSPDSWQYLSAAKSLLEQGELKNQDGSPYTLWPPLFPLILSLFVKSEYLLLIVQILNLTCLLFSLLMIFLISGDILSNKLLRIVSFAVIALSFPLIYSHSSLWTEPLFILLSTLNLFLLKEYFISLNTKIIFSIILIGVLLVLQRNAGLFLVTGTFISLLTFTQKENNEKILVYPIAPSITFFIWSVRAYILNKSGFQRLVSPFTNVWENFDYYLYITHHWLMPFKMRFRYKLLIHFSLLVLTIYLALCRKYQSSKFLKSLITIMLTYTILLLVSTKVYINDIDRYFSNTYPFLILLFFVTLNHFFYLTKSIYIKLSLGAIALIFMIYSTLNTFEKVKELHLACCAEAAGWNSILE